MTNATRTGVFNSKVVAELAAALTGILNKSCAEQGPFTPDSTFHETKMHGGTAYIALITFRSATFFGSAMITQEGTGPVEVAFNAPASMRVRFETVMSEFTKALSERGLTVAKMIFEGSKASAAA